MRDSHARRRGPPEQMHGRDDTVGGHDQALKAVQIRVREGDRHVSARRSAVPITKRNGAHLLRYAYFKKLTYFSTECIYSPDGQCNHSQLL